MFIILTGVVALLVSALVVVKYPWGKTEYKIMSDDSKATLIVPKDALPKGVKYNNLSVRKLSGGEVPESISRFSHAAVYALEPSGIHFEKPVSLSIVYDNPGKIMPFLLHVDASGKASFPDNLVVEINRQKKTAVYTGEIQSFSFLSLMTQIGWPAMVSIGMDDDLGTYLVGESFPVKATVLKYGGWEDVIPGNVPTINLGSYQIMFGRNDAIYYTLIGDPKITGKFRAFGRAIKPKAYSDAPPLTQLSQLTHSSERWFTCAAGGEADITYSARAAVTIKSDVYINDNLISEAMSEFMNWISPEVKDFIVEDFLIAGVRCVVPAEEKQKKNDPPVKAPPPPAIDPGNKQPPESSQTSPPPEPPPPSLPGTSQPPASSPPSGPKTPPEAGQTFPLDDASASDDYTPPSTAIVHFRCAITKTNIEGLTYVRLESSAQAVDKDGNDASGKYLFGDGSGNISGPCSDESQLVPVCVDPRTGATADSLDFTSTFPNTAGGQSTFSQWFSKMTNTGKRLCSAAELSQ